MPTATFRNDGCGFVLRQLVEILDERAQWNVRRTGDITVVGDFFRLAHFKLERLGVGEQIIQRRGSDALPSIRQAAEILVERGEQVLINRRRHSGFRFRGSAGRNRQVRCLPRPKTTREALDVGVSEQLQCFSRHMAMF